MENPIGLGINLTLVGMTVVFMILSMIAILVIVIRLLDKGWESREIRQKTEALEKIQTIDDLTLILISAAVATMIQGRHRIRSVARVVSTASSSPWSMQGRSVLLGSHSITKGQE